jgi:hypothetical protein
VCGPGWDRLRLPVTDGLDVQLDGDEVANDDLGTVAGEPVKAELGSADRGPSGESDARLPLQGPVSSTPRTSVSIATGRVTWLRLRLPLTIQRSPWGCTALLWKVMAGFASTLKNRGYRRSWSRISFPVLTDARSMVAVTCERVRSSAVVIVP